MVAVTYGTARVTRSKSGQKAENWFARFYQALLTARRHQANIEIARHRHLLSAAPMTFGRVRRDDLPFARG